jgi:thiol-disulfide isomerase/thioredoxin
MNCWSFVGIAQSSSVNITTDGRGIKWNDELTWKEVKEKAKEQNKYIFIDFYATWCGPCKRMDKNVYVNDSIGKFFNDKFISVKVQIDKTERDNDYIKNWYVDALLLQKEYKIVEYPSFVFLSPLCMITHKDVGYKSVNELLTIGEIALVPNKVYDDPYKVYDSLVKEYRQGRRYYDRMPYMITTALKLRDNDFALQLVREHTSYLMTLTKNARYTRNNIEMWSAFSISTKTRIFDFFYKDGFLIDKVMNQKGYSAKVVDKSIMDEIVAPFLKDQNKNSLISVSGMFLTNDSLVIDHSEADWRKLKKLIGVKFDKYFIKRVMILAKIEWYMRHRNFVAASKYSLHRLNRYSSEVENPNLINNMAFYTLMYSTDKKIIDGFIEWMEKVVASRPFIAVFIDTYASLLYKAGRVNEALKWEEKAIKIAPDDEVIIDDLKKMREGKPLEGAVWGYK